MSAMEIVIPLTAMHELFNERLTVRREEQRVVFSSDISIRGGARMKVGGISIPVQDIRRLIGMLKEMDEQK